VPQPAHRRARVQGGAGPVNASQRGRQEYLPRTGLGLYAAH
jgi:hypothetical protein